MNIDFKLLAKQKEVIDGLIVFNEELTRRELGALEGILHLIDALEDEYKNDDDAHEGGVPIMLVHSSLDDPAP